MSGEVSTTGQVNAAVENAQATLSYYEQWNSEEPHIEEMHGQIAANHADALAHHLRAVLAAVAGAWDEGAIWAAIECGVIEDQRNLFLAPGDNPYRKEGS